MSSQKAEVEKIYKDFLDKLTVLKNELNLIVANFVKMVESKKIQELKSFLEKQ